MNRETFVRLAKQCKENPLLNDLLSSPVDVYLVEAVIDVGICKIAISIKKSNIRYEFEPSEIQPFVRYLWNNADLRMQVNLFRQRLLQMHMDCLEKLMI